MVFIYNFDSEYGWAWKNGTNHHWIIRSNLITKTLFTPLICFITLFVFVRFSFSERMYRREFQIEKSASLYELAEREREIHADAIFYFFIIMIFFLSISNRYVREVSQNNVQKESTQAEGGTSRANRWRRWSHAAEPVQKKKSNTIAKKFQMKSLFFFSSYWRN